MKHGVVAALSVLFLGTALARADYLEFKVDVKNANPYVQVDTSLPNPRGIPQRGGFGNGGNAGTQNGTQAAPVVVNLGKSPELAADSDHLWVYAYLEIRGKLERVPNTRNVAKVDHQFGQKLILVDLQPRPGEPPPFMRVTKITKQLPARAFAAEFTRLKEAPNVKEFVKLARLAWSYGLDKQLHDVIGEIKKINPKHPVVTAYGQIQDRLKAPLTDEDPALKGYLDRLRSEGYRALASEQGHYALYTNLPPIAANDAQVKRYLTRLEETFEAFYLWFALQDNVAIPPMPRFRLLGLVVNEPDEFYAKHKSTGLAPMMGDGFTPRRDNVMILSAKPLDDAYLTLEQKTQGWLRKISATSEEALHGDIWRRPDLRGAANAVPASIIQTMVVVQKALQDDAERATLSHEGVRQLLAASGLLPRQIAAPEWLQEGLAGYFERPLGAVYGFGGLPSWSNLVAFKYYQAHGLGKGRSVLTNVITDRYFTMARAADVEGDPNSEKAADKDRADWERARATSWALVYYLIEQNKLDQLLQYTSEIARLPRDLPLRERTLAACFAQAFDLADRNDGRKLDVRKLQAFADSWIEFMQGVNLELTQVQDSSREALDLRHGTGPKKNGPSTKGPPRGNPPPPPPVPPPPPPN